jgi:hypothetical protein
MVDSFVSILHYQIKYQVSKLSRTVKHEVVVKMQNLFVDSLEHRQTDKTKTYHNNKPTM